MAYAWDNNRKILVEAPIKEIDASSHLLPRGAAWAHLWVKDGGQHETSLYVGDGGRVRRARGGE